MSGLQEEPTARAPHRPLRHLVQFDPTSLRFRNSVRPRAGFASFTTGNLSIRLALAVVKGRFEYGGVVLVSRRRFEELVADALDAIPPGLADEMDNVAVVVEDWPAEQQVTETGSAGTLLGLYEGVALTRRSPLASALPDRITIFRGPLCQLSSDEVDLAEHVRTTILHEIGHHFGMSDEQLRELGWA